MVRTQATFANFLRRMAQFAPPPIPLWLGLRNKGKLSSGMEHLTNTETLQIYHRYFE